MKILHIVPSYKPAFVYGGPIVSVSSLCENQVALGHQVTVYTTTANGKSELQIAANQAIKVDNVDVFYFNRVTKDHTHLSPRLLAVLWKTVDQFDVVHIHSWWNVLVILATMVCCLKGVKPILSPRGMLTQYTFGNQHSIIKRIIHGTVGIRLLRRTTLHATTELELTESKQLYAQWPSFVLPNIVTFPPLNLDVRTFAHTQDNDCFKLLFMSRIDPKKGLELLFKSLAVVDFPYELTIAGEGKAAYVEVLKQLASDLQIEDRIHWVGWQSGASKYKLLHQADLFVLTSYNENFANVVLESLFVGTAVLVSKKVGLFSYVSSNNLGWVCDLTPNSIKTQLELAYTSIEDRESIRKIAPSNAKEDFAGEVVSQKYIVSYQAFTPKKETHVY